MTTGVEITIAFNDARLQGVLDWLALGSGNAYVDVFGGVRPALGDTPATPALVRIFLVEPVGTLTGGVLTLTPTPECMIDNSGQATWARVHNGVGTLGFQCDVSDMEGAGQLKMQSTTLYNGGYTRIVSGTFT